MGSFTQYLHSLSLLSVIFSSQFLFVTSTCETSEDLSADIKGDTGSFGNMFDLVAKDSAVRITQIDFYTDVVTNVTFHLWSKSGTYIGYETNPTAWTKYYTGWTMGAGTGKTTPIPNRYLPPFTIAAGDRMSFVLVLEEPDIRYDMGTKEGDPLVESEYLVLTQGKGVAQFPPFPEDGTYYSPRVFNGKVTYEPLVGCGDSNNHYGNGVSNRPGKYPNKEPLSTIVQLTYTYNIQTQESSIAVEGEIERFVSEIINKSINDSTGYGNKNHKELIEMSELSLESVEAKYIGSCRSISCHTIEVTVSVNNYGNEYVSTEEIRYFLLLHASLIEKKLRYDRTDYAGPQPVVTEKVMSLEGVSLQSFDDQEAMTSFEKTTKEFLARTLDPVFTIARVKITSRSSKNDGISKMIYGGRIINRGGVRHRRHLEDIFGDKYENYDSVSSRNRQHSFESVDLGVTITGEYQPPPDMDFEEMTQESFDNDAETLIEMLQNEPTGQFQDLATVSSVTDDLHDAFEPSGKPYPTSGDDTSNVYDSEGDLTSAGATAGTRLWNKPELISIYVIAGIVVGAAVFAMWIRAVRAEDHSDADSRDMTYSGSIYSVLREKSPTWMGGSTGGGAAGYHRTGAATAPPGNVIVGQGGGRSVRQSAYARYPDDPPIHRHSQRGMPSSYHSGSFNSINDGGGVNLAQSSRMLPHI